MKSLALAAFAILASPSAFAGPLPTIDQIEVLKCTVTESHVRNSFIPPKPGDTILIATWQLELDELKFDRADLGGTNSYASLPVPLERVDHSGLRNENLRTFMGIQESPARQERTEEVLKIEGSESKITASLGIRSRHLPDGPFLPSDSLVMNCMPEKLWNP